MNYFLSGPSGIKPSVMNWLGIHPSRKLNILSLEPDLYRIRLRQPVCSYTPITIIRMILRAGMLVHFYCHVL